MPSRWDSLAPFIPALRANDLEGQTYTTGFHYLPLDKSIVCRCNKVRHSGCGKVQNDDIQTWSERFFHYHPKEMTCNREQWRAYSHGPPQNLQAADRKYLEGVPDTDELFHMASAKFRSAYARGLSSHDALDVTKTYMFKLTGRMMTSLMERMLLSPLPTELQARTAHEEDEDAVFGLNMQGEALCSPQRRRSIPTSPRANPRLRSETGAPPVILQNPSNSATPRPAPTQSHPKPSSSSQHDRGVPSRNTQSHPEFPSPQHDQGVSSSKDDEDATTACLRLALNAVPHAAPQLILSLIDEATLCQKGVQRHSRDIINRLLYPNWEASVTPCFHNTHRDTEMAVEAQQLAQTSRSGSFDGLTQRVALEELTSPHQDPWREVPIEPAVEVPGPSQEDTVPERCKLSTQQPPNAIPAELPATAPTTNGRLQDFPGLPSPNVPPFNWRHNPYGNPQLQPHRAATKPSVVRSSEATMQSHVPHDAVVSTSFSGSRPDFQSDFLEQNGMGLDPFNYAQHEQLPTRKAKYPPAPYVSSASPSPPPQNSIHVTSRNDASLMSPHREHQVRHVQDDRTGALPSGRSSKYAFQRDANVSPPPRRRDIATRQYETSDYQRRRHPSSPIIREGMHCNVDSDEIFLDQANRAVGGGSSQGNRFHFFGQGSQDEWNDDSRLGRTRDV
jgi:hypothetical protein